MKILVVEDDASLAEMLEAVLKTNQYQVELAADGITGLALLEAFDYDLVLLDLRLPKLDGISFCQRVRTTGAGVPILLMTAEDTTASKIAGLDAGADDYVIKPLNLDELLARIRALLRRGQTETAPILCWGAVSLDPSNCEVFCFGERRHLTGKEYEMLELFLRNPHRIFSLDILIERLWAYKKMPSDNAVRTHIKSLRRKLKQGGVVNMVETVYGLGYRLGPEPYTEPSPVSDSVAAVVPTLEESPLVATVNPSEPAPVAADSAIARLNDIWQKHKQRYLDLITLIEEIVPVLAVPNTDRMASLARHQDELLRSQQAAHTLKGALGSFGFMQASKIVANIEKLLFSTQQTEIETIKQLPTLIQALRQSLQQSSGESDTLEASTEKKALYAESNHRQSPRLPEATNPLPAMRLSQQSPPVAYPVVYQWLIVERDPVFVELLIRQAAIWSIQTRIATTLAEARQALAQHSPGAVMVDPSCANTPEEGLQFLRELAAHQPALSVIVATDLNALSESPEDRLRHRVDVMRASQNSLFLQKPVAVDQVLETISQSLIERPAADARVLILDDDPQILQCLKLLLAPWGFQLTLLSNPVQFWDALEQAVPDLLILDIEMPDFNGLELCQVIRHDPNFSQLPILFLSAHTGTDIVQRVFECGADDYISKPIVGPELVARILNRLERFQLLKRLAEIDGLTGLSCRRQSVEQFSRLMRLANRQQTTVCLALLDLDKFKQVNDQYGHEMGDQVLKTFGDRLQNAFRGEDIVARWGGEEFVVGLYNTPKEMAIQRISTFLEQFRQHVFSYGKGKGRKTFQVSFSGGIAEYPTNGETIRQLYQHADEVLYQAKATGRSRVLATDQPG